MLTSMLLINSPTYNNLDQGVTFISEKDEISLLPLNKEEKSFLEKMLFENNKDSVSLTNEKSQSLFIKQYRYCRAII